MGTLKPNPAYGKRFTLRDFLDSQSHCGNAPGRVARNLEIVSRFIRCSKPGTTVPVEVSLCVEAMDGLLNDLVDAGNEFFVWRLDKQYPPDHLILLAANAKSGSGADDQF